MTKNKPQPSILYTTILKIEYVELVVKQENHNGHHSVASEISPYFHTFIVQQFCIYYSNKMST